MYLLIIMIIGGARISSKLLSFVDQEVGGGRMVQLVVV
jgi:hypothetical protein